MTLIRGRGLGLELQLAGLDFDTAMVELEAKLSEQPGFYQGSGATAVVSESLAPEQEARLSVMLAEFGIDLRGVESQASPGEEFARRRALRPRRELKLSDSAKSLVADFAGARADIAERRKLGQTSVRRVNIDASKQTAPPPLPAPLQVAAPTPPPPGSLYHVGTLRGGQALHHIGNLIVVGDVNPGTELVATGDIVVFGRLLGVAHAGAQGDETARVYALHLEATQLRIASCIAVDDESNRNASGPEVAFVQDGRITIAPFSKAGGVL
jgi:septum site-determining protein MinC